MVDQPRTVPATHPSAPDERDYTIRPAREGDREQLLALYQTVLDDGLSDRWFEWKYVDNPYTTAVPVYVAEYDGQVVGAGGFWLLELSTGARTMRAVQPCDAAVDPDHRRQGLYTRILGAGLEHFAADGVDIAFDFPNELSQATFEKFGWQPVQECETAYRVQRPVRLLGTDLDGIAGSILDRGAGLAVRGYFSVRQRQRSMQSGSLDTDTLEVERHETVPVETLSTLYRRAIPKQFHAVRDERFFGWRFENPQWTYRTYVARYDGSPLGAIVTGTQVIDGTTVTKITDVLPLEGDGTHQHHVLGALLETLLDDVSQSAVVVAPSSAIPSTVLRRYGFQSSRSFPLSLGASQTIHGVCTLSSEAPTDGFQIDGLALTDPDSWRITFSEYDTS